MNEKSLIRYKCLGYDKWFHAAFNFLDEMYITEIDLEYNLSWVDCHKNLIKRVKVGERSYSLVCDNIQIFGHNQQDKYYPNSPAFLKFVC